MNGIPKNAQILLAIQEAEGSVEPVHNKYWIAGKKSKVMLYFIQYTQTPIQTH